MSLRLYSEYGTLEMVLTHRPSREIERLTPYNQSELLFEDVPYLEVMQQEHDFFTQLMRSTTNTRVLKIHDLLIDILLDKRITGAAMKSVANKIMPIRSLASQGNKQGSRNCLPGVNYGIGYHARGMVWMFPFQGFNGMAERQHSISL